MKRDSLARAAFASPQSFDTGGIRATVQRLAPASKRDWSSQIAVNFDLAEAVLPERDVELGILLSRGSSVVHHVARTLKVGGAGDDPSGVTFLEPITLSPGKYSLSVVVFDAAAEVPRSTQVAIEVPDVPRQGPFLVGPLIGRLGGSTRVVRGMGGDGASRGKDGSYEPLLDFHVGDPRDLVAVTQVCDVERGDGVTTRQVGRSLRLAAGSAIGDFKPVGVRLDGNEAVRCGSLVDVIPASALAQDGEYLFEASFVEDDKAPISAVRFWISRTQEVAPTMLTASTVAPAKHAVPWTEVREAIGELICVLAQTDPNGREGYNAVAGMRKLCNLTPVGTPLERAVDNAYAAAQPLTASMQPDGLNAAFEKGLSSGERTRRAREAYLSSADFLRAVVPRLREAMTVEGIDCEGCPVLLPKPIRKTRWTEFRPYLAAYAWPDPVQTPKDATGPSSGASRYSFHVCGGLNGIGELKNPDPLLVRAGFVAAYQNTEFLQSAGTQFGEALNAPEFLELGDDDARTRYLRNRVPSETVKDPTVRAAACRALREFQADLGVEISDCTEEPAAPAATLGRP